MTHFRFACGAAAIIALVAVLAIGRSQAPPVVATEPVFTEVWNDAASSVVLKNADARERMVMEANTAPRVVPLTKIDMTPSKVPEAIVLPDPPQAKKEKPKEKYAEVNVCTKHNMTKTWVSKYRWRCKK